ncbi:MAG: M23 family metallopeptidase [candidate division WOR-3 bacterium]|nr:MAG: M23 family metallopeptidase [candidate division WOR-3 bacterium]
MFKQFELILTTACLALTVVFIILIMIRVRSIFLMKARRVPLWHERVNIVNKIVKVITAISLPLMTMGIINFIFIVSIPSVVIRVYAKTLFIIIFGIWALLEFMLSLSISEKLLKGGIFRRILYFLAVIICIAGAVRCFPLIPQSWAYPSEDDCVILDLPVRGVWLAGQAGASVLTNGHISNRYAIDILKFGPDGRLFKGKEESVADFYSYGEEIHAPADGRITEVQDGIPSDLMGNMDKDHPGGNYIIMDIGQEKYVYFGHLINGSITVEEGQSVTAGTVLGRVGNSGYSTHPHLHMHVQNKPVSDPDGRITYPFRFAKIRRNRLMFWQEVKNGALLRGDRFSD